MRSGNTLDLQMWRQQATLVAPADSVVADKALTRGTASARDLLGRASVTEDELGQALGVDPHLVRRALELPVPAPAVVLDAEDGVSGSNEAHISAAIAAGTRFRETPALAGQLRFFRGLNPRERAAHEVIAAFLDALRDGACDGIVLPKVGAAQEIDTCVHWLESAEKRHLRTPLYISVMIETARGVLNAGSILHAAPSRICSVAIGAVDLAADVGWLGSLPNRPELNYLRYQIALQAAAASPSIPALDGMTIEFPVPPTDATTSEGHQVVLDRMALVGRETRAALASGLRGKWVGHPLQLFAVLVTFADTFSPLSSRSQHERGPLVGMGGRRGVWLAGSDMQDAATDARLSRFDTDAKRLGYYEGAADPTPTPSARWFSQAS